MFLSAHYFRAHLYTLVPRQVRDDLKWMADLGTQAVVLGLLEQDFDAARENVDLICRAGRSGGVGDAQPVGQPGGRLPKVPSIFCSLHHEAWLRDANGKPTMGFLGPLVDVAHPATFEFFTKTVTRLLEQWPIQGIIWDEWKALEVPGQLRAQVEFFGRINVHARRFRPALRISGFVFGSFANRPWLGELASMDGLDEFGLDGRPWAAADGGGDDNPGHGRPTKFLLDHRPVFQGVAAAAGKRSLFLIENHALRRVDDALMDRRLPEVLALRPDHLIYYYYPRSLEDPDGSMAIVARHLRRR